MPVFKACQAAINRGFFTDTAYRPNIEGDLAPLLSLCGLYIAYSSHYIYVNVLTLIVLNNKIEVGLSAAFNGYGLMPCMCPNVLLTVHNCIIGHLVSLPGRPS